MAVTFVCIFHLVEVNVFMLMDELSVYYIDGLVQLLFFSQSVIQSCILLFLF